MLKTLKLPDLATAEFDSAAVDPVRQIDLALLDVGYGALRWAPQEGKEKRFEVHGADEETKGVRYEVGKSTPTSIGRSLQLPAKSLSRNQLTVQVHGGLTHSLFIVCSLNIV